MTRYGSTMREALAKIRGVDLQEAPEDNMPASPDEGSMAVQQLEFMMHAVERMKMHIQSGGEFPEWMQNKLSGTHEKLKGLYANIEHGDMNEGVEPIQWPSQPLEEEIEIDEMKMDDPKLVKTFDKLKKGQTIKLKTSSTINQGKDFVEYIVKSKNTVNKGRVEKVTLVTKGNEKAVKKFLYKRDGKVTFAIGDMGASIDDIKEGTWALPDSPKAKAELKKLMSKPIKLGKEGDEASDKLYALIGDDELFDDLYVAGKKNPNGDARDVVKKHMKRLGIKEEVELDEKTTKTFGVEFQINAPDEKPIRTGNEPHVKLVNKLVKKYKLFDDHADDLSKFNVKDDVGGRDVQKFFNDLSKAGYDVVKKKVTDNYTSRTLGKEGFELDEAVLSGRDYKVKDGKVHISKANFKKVSKDYKNDTRGKERMVVLDPKTQATVSMPVIFEETELDEAPKMKYALVGTDMKIYSMGSDERDLRLDRRSLEQRFKDVAPLKMARLKTAQSIGDKVDKSQLKEEEGEPDKPDTAKAVDQGRDDKKKTRIAQLQLQIAKAQETINKLNAQEKPNG